MRTYRLIFWNLLLLVIIKTALPHVGFEFAAITQPAPVFAPSEIRIETNLARHNQGLPALEQSVVLDISAAQKLQDMVAHQYFAHTSPTGTTPWYWFKNNHYDYAYAGENLAIGFLDAKSTVQAWMDSPSHRNNLLSSRFTQIGIAVEWAKIGEREGIVVVQHFGQPAGASVQAVATTQPTTTAQPEKPTAKISFSQSSANEEITSPSPAATPAPIKTPAKENSSNQLKPVTTSPRASQTVHILDSAFAIYSFLVAAFFFTLLAIRGWQRHLVYKTIASSLIALAAMSVPLLPIIQRGFIF